MPKILTLRPDHSEASSQQPVYFQDPNSGKWDWYPRGRLPQAEPPKTPFGKLKNLLLGLGAFLALWAAFLILVFVLAEVMDWIVT